MNFLIVNSNLHSFTILIFFTDSYMFVQLQIIKPDSRGGQRGGVLGDQAGTFNFGSSYPNNDLAGANKSREVANATQGRDTAPSADFINKKKNQMNPKLKEAAN